MLFAISYLLKKAEGAVDTGTIFERILLPKKIMDLKFLFSGEMKIQKRDIESSYRNRITGISFLNNGNISTA